MFSYTPYPSLPFKMPTGRTVKRNNSLNRRGGRVLTVLFNGLDSISRLATKRGAPTLATVSPKKF